MHYYFSFSKQTIKQVETLVFSKPKRFLFMTIKLHFQYALSGLLALCSLSEATAQQATWKAMRQRGANFYEIQDTFERQNAALLQTFQTAAAPRHEGDSTGKFNSIIKYNRWAHRVKARVTESQGDLSAITAGNARALAQRATEVQTRTGESWRAISPPSTPTDAGNGRINAVRVHPTNANILFACSPAGGLWKSVNGGDAWEPTSENIALLGCSDVAFSPTDPNTMYLATGDGEASDSYSTGVYKSTDGGATWLATGLTFTAGEKIVLSRLLVNPTNGNLLVSSSNGIYRSTNGGTAWTLTNTDDTRDMEFKSDNPNIVFATKYAPTSACFLRSTDGGANWTTISTGLPTSGVMRAAIAVTPADANYVYLMLANDVDYGLLGIYRSTDGGVTFTNQTTWPSNTMGWSSSGSDSGGQGWYDISIAVSPTNRELLFTGGVNIWKSTNGGASFTIAGHWIGDGAPYVHADIHDLVFNGSTLWVGCDGGVFKTTNNGTSWTDKSSNLSIAQMYGMGLSATNANLILSGHQDNGTNLMTSPTDWSRVIGGDGMQCFIDRTNNNNLFGSLYYGRVYRSTNGGMSFSSLPSIPNGNWVTPWLQDPVTATTLYAGGKEVFKSTDFGNNWSQVSNFGGTVAIAAIDVARTNAQILFAAKGTYVTARRAYTAQVFKSTNGGNNWTEVTSPNFPANASIIGLHIDVNNINRIYVGFASYAGTSVYISNDGGATWANYSTGLPQVPANCFVTTLGNANGEVFVGTDIGVYHRTNHLTAWEPFSNNLPSAPVSDLEIFYPTALLRIATFGRGVWETVLPGYNAPPIVRLTAPTAGQLFTSPATINLAATATDPDGRVTQVQFYSDATLIATDSSAPYTATWTNVAAGNYHLTAKATDDSSAVMVSTAVMISVIGANDAQLSAIVTPNTTIAVDSVFATVRLRNAGANPLTTAAIYYKLDNGTLQNYTWTGNLASQAEIEVRLPNVLRYTAGVHQLLTYVGNAVDENRANDTLRLTFEYQLFGSCADNYEPNNSVETATPIPVNTTVRSMLAISSDWDFFQFKTTAPRTAFTVVLNELPTDFDLTIYRYDQGGNLISMGSSASGGTQTDSVVFNNLVDTGTYYAKVYFGSHPSQCYALKVSTQEPIRYDMALDSIFAPQGNIYTSTVTPRVRLKNKGNTPVTSFVLATQLDNNSIRTNFYTFPTPLQPNDTISIPLPAAIAFSNYSVGQHAFSVSVRPTWSFLDVDTSNDTRYATFRYVLAPAVAVTQPSNDQIFAANTTVSIAATATAQNGGSITKVAFYNGNTLLTTDYAAPYTYDWANVPLGTYRIIAKAYDNDNDSTVSERITFFVSSANDAGVYGVANATDFLGYDSTRPVAQIRNYGSNALTNVKIYYRLDNQPIDSQSFTGMNLASGQRTTFPLRMVRYAIGNHTFTTWTGQPNGTMDSNTGNDTFRLNFEYLGFGACADNYEPNDNLATATPIPTNVIVRSKLATWGDMDWFMFRTTPQQPNFTVILNELMVDHDLSVYKWDNVNQMAFYIGGSSRGGTLEDSVTIIAGADTGTYFAVVSYGGGDNACYALKVRTRGAILTDIGVDTIFAPNGQVRTAFFTPVVRLRNSGQEPITSCSIYYQIDNEWPSSMTKYFSPALQPNDTLMVALQSMSWYTTGAHTFMAYTSNPNFYQDVNVRNDTARSAFTYVIPPTVSLVAPLNNQLFAQNTPIVLSATASGNGTTIASVEFYNGNTLIGTDNTAPYAYNWTNVPLGRYNIHAKAIDNLNVSESTLPRTIYVTGNPDAGVPSVRNERYIWTDSLIPQVWVRNYGTQALTNVEVHCKLNQNAVVSQTVTGLNVNRGDSTLVLMPTLRYGIGMHTLQVWSSMPNGNADQNPSNDTLQYTFEYRDMSLCGDFFEPNNTFETCTPIPTDRTIRSKIGSFEDFDGYTFKTTADRPHFTVLLNELTSNQDLALYKYNAFSGSFLYMGGSWSSGTNPDSIQYSSSIDTGTYVIAVGGGPIDNNCYALFVRTYTAPILDIGVDSILVPTANIVTSSFNPVVRVRNYGNVPVNNFEVNSFVDNNWSVYQYVSLATPLLPNQVRLVTLNSVTGYTIGNHRFTAYTGYPNGSWDMRYRNDTSIVAFRYGVLPTVSLTSPTDGTQWVRTSPQGAPVPLSATASASNGVVVKVQFYAGATLLATDSTAPYHYIWANAPLGQHRLTARVFDTQGGESTSTTTTIQILNVVPIVSWITPNQNQVFPSNSTIRLAAAASDSVDGRIVKVEFYRDNVLLGTDSIAPYQYDWANVPIGVYGLKVKAYDDAGATTTDQNRSITVKSRLDANPLSVNRPTSVVTVDTSVFQLVLKNLGFDTLNSVQINYQLNNGVTRTQAWIGALATNQTLNVDLPTLNLTNIGAQALKIWTSLPNQGADENRNNDSLNYNFNYQWCGDNYEPNNAPSTATSIVANKFYYGQIMQGTDRDFYKFSTTNARPKVRITVRHALLDAEVQLYRLELNGDLTSLAAANRRGLGRELLVWNESNLGNQYVIALTSFNNGFEVDSCYSLLVETSDTLMTGISPILDKPFQFKLAPNPAREKVHVLLQANLTQSIDNQLIVRDILGRLVFQRKLQWSDLQAPISIETEGWSKGVYLVSLQRDGQIVTEKLVIE
ncbi:MAG: hypothetical protein RIS64_355 [Bacteroidota bacterium]